MKTEIEHFPVNWVDGMKISRVHFEQTENAIYDQIRDAYSLPLNTFNFGLLPQVSIDKPSIDIVVMDKQPNYIKLKLNLCRAVTESGFRIEITPAIVQSFNSTKLFEVELSNQNMQASNFDVLLSVNLFKRLPIGKPNPEETPVRHPSSIFDYQLSIIPTEKVNQNDISSNILLVGKINIKGDDAVFDTTFIPPCTTIHSHPVLFKFYKELGKAIFEMNDNCSKIITNVLGKKQNSDLASNVKAIAEQLVYTIADGSYEYKSIGFQHSPFYLVNFIIKLANKIKAVIQTVNEKEKLIRYLTNWGDIKQGNYESMLDETTTIKYNHFEIYQTLKKVESFLALTAHIMNKLSSMDILEEKGAGPNMIISQKEVRGDKGKGSDFSVFAD